MFLSTNDSILGKLTELHIVVAQKRMPEENKCNILHIQSETWASTEYKSYVIKKITFLKRHCRKNLNPLTES